MTAWPRNAGHFPLGNTLLSFLGAVLVLGVVSGCLFGGGNSPTVSLTAQERAWLDQHRDNITMFYNTDFPPLEYAASDGAFEGYGADIIAEIESLLDVRFIKTLSRDWNQHLAALEKGDCAIAPTIVQTPERAHYAFFTPPYATAPVVIIVSDKIQEKLSLAQLAGRRVAVVSGYATEQYVREHLGGTVALVRARTVAEGLRDVSFGQVDALVENLAVAAYFIKQEGLPNLRVAGSTDYSFAWSIGVSRHYPLLFSAIEKALAAIPPEQRGAIHQRWISLDTTTGLNPETVRLMKWTAAFTALLLLALSIITVVLKGRLNQKVLVLKQAQKELVAQTERLRESENLNRALFDQTVVFLGLLDTEGRIVKANQTSLQFIGMNAGQEQGKLFYEMPWWPDRAQAEAVCREGIAAVLRGGTFRREVPHRDTSGTDHIFDFSLSPLRDDAGALMYFIAEGRDITGLKRAEEERNRLQEQLLQSQKMEAVGRLAGGVAHDFNNMLQAIIGHTEMILEQIDSGSPLYEDLSEVRIAAERSADLTRQLLAFARKQTVMPKTLDLNETVEGMLKMLRRLIGENVSLVWHPGQDVFPVKMDPTQMDQILANLCVNARDAIAGVGQIVIETSNCAVDAAFCATHPGASPGQYAMLSISDTGKGMDEKTLANIFEPFFTTKELGQGTGLGLATVYGAIRQNHGLITVSSAPKQGTVFKIFLPRHVEQTEVEEPADAAECPPAHGELVLLVEDEPSILNVTRNMLQQIGYTVIAASSPRAAQTHAEKHQGLIHVLMTDVVMPEMNGRELAERLCAARPDMKCLFMSGYNADVIAHHGILNQSIHFIQKPFTKQALAAKLRELLES